MSRTYTAGLPLDRSSPEGCVRQTLAGGPTNRGIPGESRRKRFFFPSYVGKVRLWVSPPLLSRVSGKSQRTCLLLWVGKGCEREGERDSSFYLLFPANSIREEEGGICVFIKHPFGESGGRRVGHSTVQKTLFLFFAVDDSISEEKGRKRSGTSGNVAVLLVREKTTFFSAWRNKLL